MSSTLIGRTRIRNPNVRQNQAFGLIFNQIKQLSTAVTVRAPHLNLKE